MSLADERCNRAVLMPTIFGETDLQNLEKEILSATLTDLSVENRVHRCIDAADESARHLL